jgi:predicted DNA-binding transcriptional regulator AlpA
MTRYRELDDPKKPTHNKRKLPIDQRDWLKEPEAADWMGISHSALRSWRYEDRDREKQGLPTKDKAPRVLKSGGKLIRYLKIEVRAWIKRHSSRPDDKE